MTHELMQDVAQEDFAYEKIMAEPTVQLQILADALGVAVKVTSIVHFYACFVSASIVRCPVNAVLLSAAPVWMSWHHLAT